MLDLDKFRKHDDVLAMPVETCDDRVHKALALIMAYGGIDGAHHKDWVLDQVTRALTGSVPEEQDANDWKGTPYKYWEQVPSDDYKKLIAFACAGKDGPNTYSWEEGIAP